MEWVFLVTAFNRARVESRLLQVLDHLMIPTRSFASVRAEDTIRVSFIAEMNQATAIRTGDLLRRLHDVQSVASFETQDELRRTTALFKDLFDRQCLELRPEEGHDEEHGQSA